MKITFGLFRLRSRVGQALLSGLSDPEKKCYEARP
jgi:hypothetical protein